MTLTDSVESVEIHGFDEITQDDVLEKRPPLNRPRKVERNETARIGT